MIRSLGFWSDLESWDEPVPSCGWLCGSGRMALRCSQRRTTLVGPVIAKRWHFSGQDATLLGMYVLGVVGAAKADARTSQYYDQYMGTRLSAIKSLTGVSSLSMFYSGAAAQTVGS